MIRNDANYRGFKITTDQSQELVDFWSEVGKEIIKLLRKNIQK